MNSVKTHIKSLLERKSLSEERLVKSTGLSFDDLYHALEEGAIDLRTLEHLAKELRVPLYSLIHGEFSEIAPAQPDEITQLRNDNKQLRLRVHQLEQILSEGGKLNTYINNVQN
jgi:hypothetical protein